MNKTFQFIWYRFLKSFFPRSKPRNTGVLLDDYGFRMYWKIKISKVFGLKLVVFGDSNSENLNSYKFMKRFPKVSVNIGIGGTTVEQWDYFFDNGYYGKKIYEIIKDITILANIGGNNVIQDKMYGLERLPSLAKKFKTVYWINIPKVWHKFFPRDITLDLAIANSKIKQVAGNKLLDIESVTDSGEDNQPYFFVHQDAVHYSEIFDKRVRIPLVLLKIYGKK
jgi:hypothetical protein